MPLVYLMPLGKVESAVLEAATRALEETFLLEVRLGEGIREIDYAYDAVRKQYHVSKLLGDLIRQPPPDAFRIQGIAEVDLFLPIFTFLFGEAQLNGVGSILSTFRLRSEFYGLPKNPGRLAERVGKEAIHELGHTFGLLHCIDPVCVMRSSTYVEDVDFKSAEFCMSCRTRLNEKLPRKKRVFPWG